LAPRRPDSAFGASPDRYTRKEFDMTSNLPETLAAIALVAAGIFASVAVAQQAGGQTGGGRDFQTNWCTRYEALTLAATYGIRQGRAEQVANDRMAVTGTRQGKPVRMTFESTFDHCQVVKLDPLSPL